MTDEHDDGEYFYDPSLEDKFPRDEVIDPSCGMTWGNCCDALRQLYEEKGHSGPYTLDEFYNAILDVMITPELKALIEKGLVEAVMMRDGKMGYQLTELGMEVNKSIPDLVADEMKSDE